MFLVPFSDDRLSAADKIQSLEKLASVSLPGVIAALRVSAPLANVFKHDQTSSNVAL
jgi:hypothetical protein